jgi:hypothetical protein
MIGLPEDVTLMLYVLFRAHLIHLSRSRMVCGLILGRRAVASIG